MELFEIKQKTDAERLREISEESRNKTQAQRQYESFLEQCTEAAKHGMNEGGMQLMKKSYFELLGEQLKSRGADNVPDNFAEEQYAAQSEVLELVKKNGFQVDVKEKSGLIILNQEPQNPADQYIEADVIVRW